MIRRADGLKEKDAPDVCWARNIQRDVILRNSEGELLLLLLRSCDELIGKIVLLYPPRHPLL